MTDHEGKYRGIDNAYVLELGKIAVVGAVVEDVAYQVGEALGMESTSLRLGSGSTAADKARTRLAETGLPPWAAPTSDAVDAWCSKAKGSLKERGKLIHATMFHRAESSDWVVRFMQTGRVGAERDAAIKPLLRLRQRMDGLASEGHDLAVSLLPMIAPQVYMYTWGPKAGTFMARYENGQYPSFPVEREGMHGVIDRTWDWCESLLHGEPTEVQSQNSPEGVRLVPSWFGDLSPIIGGESAL